MVLLSLQWFGCKFIGRLLSSKQIFSVWKIYFCEYYILLSALFIVLLSTILSLVHCTFWFIMQPVDVFDMFMYPLFFFCQVWKALKVYYNIFSVCVCMCACRSLCLKFPRKHSVMMGFLSSMLREEVREYLPKQLSKTMMVIMCCCVVVFNFNHCVVCSILVLWPFCEKEL